MKKNIIYKLLILGCVMMLGFTSVTKAQSKGTKITATVVDEQGNPLEGVKVFAAKGVTATTDSNGAFTITMKGNQVLVIEKEGFDTKMITTSNMTGKIMLTIADFLASDDDVIKMGVKTSTKRDMVGAVSTINPQEHLTYDNTQNVTDYIKGLMPGVKGSANIRGLGNALFVIDGVIGRDPDMLNMEEVDQITVLKDANAVALYGSQAKYGVIVINTKRGQVNKQTAKVNIRYGMRQPIALPNYLGSVEYMKLYNEARANDGLDLVYDPDYINEYNPGLNPYRYPDVDFYSSQYLRDYTNTADVLTEFSGGSESTQYYVNMGWNHDQSLVKMNPDANVGKNRFNIRGNIDFRVNDFITSSVDVVGVINSNKTARTNLLNAGTSFLPNSYAPLLPVSMVDTTYSDELRGQLDAAGIYDGMLLGGSQVFQNNTPVGDVMAGGYQNSIYRSTQVNNAINFDLSMITEGLSAKTYLSFDFYDGYNVTIKNKFRVYEPTWQGDSIIGLTPYGDVDLKDQTENVETTKFESRIGFYGLLNYQKSISENHFINATLLGYSNSQRRDGRKQVNRNSHIGFQLSYDYMKKLYLDFTGAYVHSIKFAEGNRGAFSPTVGIGYVVADNAGSSGILNYLKLKATGGILKSDVDIDEYFYYDEHYSNGPYFEWNDGDSNRQKDITQGANRQLTFEERIDLNIGFESYLMNALWLEFNYFKSDFDKQLTRLDNNYPSFYDVFRPYDNYNKDTYQGFELGMDYLKKFNNVSVKLGGNLMYSQSKAVKRSEVYEYDYLYKVGQRANAMFGLEDDGFYTENDFTANTNGELILNEDMPVPAWRNVQPGDIKYVDQNNDGIIDDNDKKVIGQNSNPWSYGLNFRVQYKGLSLFVMGFGQFGGEAQRSNDYYRVDNSDKYSETVLGRWTPETASTATYPRLSSMDDNHNYRNSTFWMYDNSFFDIQRVQLTYEFSSSVCEKLKMKNLSINVSGDNIMEIAKNKDIRQLNIGGNPQFRTFMFGLRTSF